MFDAVRTFFLKTQHGKQQWELFVNARSNTTMFPRLVEKIVTMTFNAMDMTNRDFLLFLCGNPFNEATKNVWLQNITINAAYACTRTRRPPT